MALTVLEIDTAIAQILSTGQKWVHDGTTFELANLGQLQALRKLIQSEEAIATRPTFRAFDFTGMGY